MKLARSVTNIMLGVLLCASRVSANADVCTTTECIQSSAQMLERINSDADPCDNLYEFACGMFVESTSVPDERITVDSASQYKDKIRQLLYAEIYTRNANGEIERLARGLHEACMERNGGHHATKGTNLMELREMMKKLGGWPLIVGAEWSDADWSLGEKIQELRRIYGHRSDEIIDIASFILLMQDGTERRPYANYIMQAAFYLVEPEAESFVTKTEIDDMLDFEYKLAELNYRLRRLSERFDLGGQPRDFVNTLHALQWLELFQPSALSVNTAMEEDDSEKVLEELRDLLINTSPRTQANFLIWRLVDYAGSQVGSSVKFFRFAFEQAISGQQDLDQQWIQCMNVVERELPYACSVLITEQLPPDFKSVADGIFEQVREEFSAAIANAMWLDEAQKGRLENRLRTLTPLISHPAAGVNRSEIAAFYREVAIDPQHYIPALLQLRIIDVDNKFRLAYATATANDVDNWKKYLPASSLDALYSPLDNTLRVATSALMNIVIAEDSLKFLNYGTAGFVIAREISRIVNPLIDRRRADTWPESYRNEFMARKQCLMEQYGAYRDPETSQTLDGKRLVSENLADLSGIALAYGAYERWTRAFNGTRRRLIGVDFTPEQLFWLVMAQSRCSVSREEELRRRLVSEQLRVIDMAKNSPDFANAFKCTADSAMNPARKCVIW